MSGTTHPAVNHPDNKLPKASLAHPSEDALGRIAGLLSGLVDDQHLPTSSDVVASSDKLNDSQFENKLAIVRLGVATSLFYALRSKHPPTASHSLRVAMGCSSWCERLQLGDELRDRIEVAALLHDIGKIGIPDAILKKPGKLAIEEQLTMDLCPSLGVEILRGCTEDVQLLDIIRFAHTWYEGRRDDDAVRGEAIPLGARMLAIVEAFDSMTTDHVYRPAMSRERALAELARFAGTQFDPELANDYHRMLEANPEVVHCHVIQRWLGDLKKKSSNSRWLAGAVSTASIPTSQSPVDGYFHQLMIHTHDGVAFIDRHGIVRAWNVSLNQLTGVTAEMVCGNQWDPRLVSLADRNGDRLSIEQCPILQCLSHGGNASHQLCLEVCHKGTLMVNVRVSAVLGSTAPGIDGVVAIFQDASQQASLEKRVQDLNDRVTRDPMTGVANRAEFDRRLKELTARARDGKGRFSLIIADIDHFKQVNDVYGHPAGDEAIIAFARIMSEHSREGDLVARYGGEEFVLLCPNCDNATAARRAECVREAMEATVHSFLENKFITASFGVTEYQDGDTSESVLSRADRALLRAKDNGRNRVIQLGAGGFDTLTKIEPESSGWFSWLERSFVDLRPIKDVRLVTPVPIDLVVEKLRGFVADHKATIVNVGSDELDLRMTSVFRVNGRRRSDHRMDFNVHMTFNEQSTNHRTQAGQVLNGRLTVIDVSLAPVRARDRRRSEIKEGTQQVIASLQSYLMADLQAKS